MSVTGRPTPKKNCPDQVGKLRLSWERFLIEKTMGEKTLQRAGEYFEVFYRWNKDGQKDFYLVNVSTQEILPQKYSSAEEVIRSAVEEHGCIFDELPF
jgi:hypothetical protein